jgi:predicted metal-dependent hydrolase
MKPRCAKAELKHQVAVWAERLEVDVNTVAVRSMRTKWASCSTEGNLTFNTELLGFDEAVRNYVIVHELLHFFVPNHGRLWKSLMRAHLGPYEDLDLELRRQHGRARSQEDDSRSAPPPSLSSLGSR